MTLKAIRLLSMLPQKPTEFHDRVVKFLESQWELSFGNRSEYSTVDFAEGIRAVLRELHSETAQQLDDLALSKIEARMREREFELPSEAPFARSHNGDVLLRQMCYAVARAVRPNVVVETGVCYGAKSAHLLAALDVNGRGHLTSIDLPPLGKNGNAFVGWLVPDNLRSRWMLLRGTSGRLLRPLLKELGQIDLFIHDSLHTYRNMKMEIDLAWPALRAGGVLISDDVQDNSAFLDLTRAEDVALSMVIKEQGKNAMLSVAVKDA